MKIKLLKLKFIVVTQVGKTRGIIALTLRAKFTKHIPTPNLRAKNSRARQRRAKQV
jgi:hypothetical protein